MRLKGVHERALPATIGRGGMNYSKSRRVDRSVPISDKRGASKGAFYRLNVINPVYKTLTTMPRLP